MQGRRRALVIAVYLLFLFGLVEVTARVLFAIPALVPRLWVGDHTTWRRRWVQQRSADVVIYHSFDQFDSTKGWRTKPGLRAVEVFDKKVLNTNSRGVRGQREYSYDRVAGKPRIVIIGDSFTFGEEVSDHETYPSLLEARIADSEVINLGIHGYGHDQMLILLREEGVKYRPDVVILGFVFEDTRRNLLQFRDYAKPRFVIRDDTLVIRGSPVPPPSEILRWDWARPRLYDLWSMIRHKVKPGRQDRHMRALTWLVLDEMVRTIERAGAVPLFVYLPAGTEITTEGNMTYGEEFLFSYCRKAKMVHCLSARPHFLKKRQQGMTFKTTGHWEPSGHATVAEALYEYLDGQNLFAAPVRREDSRAPGELRTR